MAIYERWVWLENVAALLCSSLAEMDARGGRSAPTLAGTTPVSHTDELLLAALQSIDNG